MFSGVAAPASRDTPVHRVSPGLLRRTCPSLAHGRRHPAPQRRAAAQRPDRLRRRVGGDRRVRHRARTDAAAVTSPTASASRPSGPALIVFLPKAWDVVLNPIAGRISDRTVDPRGPRRPWLLRAGLGLAAAFALIFAAPDDGLVGASRPAWVLVFFLAGRDGVRVLPGAVRRDAGRDHDVVRRAHPADDLAGRDPGLHDHARRRDRAADPRRGRRPRRLPRDGPGDGAC